MIRRLVCFSLFLLMAGCADLLAEREAQLQQLVGRNEAELVQIMGIPSRTYETGGLKFLAYETRRTEILPASPFYYAAPPFPGYYTGGLYGGFPPQAVNLACDTTFTLAAGIVQAFTLRGNACS